MRKKTKQKLEFNADTECHTNLRAESSNFCLRGRADQDGWYFDIEEKQDENEEGVSFVGRIRYERSRFDTIEKIDELIEMLQKAKEHVATFENTWKNGN